MPGGPILLRNDLGRAAKMASVEVTSLFEVESYRTVFQMTSTIEAELSHDVSLLAVFGSLFLLSSEVAQGRYTMVDFKMVPRKQYVKLETHNIKASRQFLIQENSNAGVRRPPARPQSTGVAQALCATLR